ncbi:MAG: N-acetyltransferase family protein [Pseudomonadota bacterium]
MNQTSRLAPQVRPARPDDYARVLEIWNPVIRHSTTIFHTEERDGAALAALVRQRRAAGRDFWVASDGGVVIGFASYDQFRGGDGYAHAMEHTVIIAPEAQGRGAGQMLMAVLERHAAQRGVHVMVAAIDAENAAGRAFHAAIGYAETGYMPQVGRKFDRWLDLVIMQKMLA